MGKEVVLQMNQISKSFPGVKALDSVSLDLEKGEVLVLVGENGAGKSTLMKILSGALTADSGEMILEGNKLTFDSPKEAMDLGIHIMYQELNYFSDMSIAENVLLGQWPKTKILKRINYHKLREDCKKILSMVGLKNDPFTEMRKLSIAEKQLVEIAKVSSKNIKVLVMDEPTSSLNDAEIEKLFTIIRKLASEGKSIIYISHRLEEVFKIANRVKVMRDGREVGTKQIADLTRNQIVSMMVGREIKEMYPKGEAKIGEVLLEAEKITNEIFKDVSFNLRRGELLGVFGLMGSGRTNIMEAIYGLRQIQSGRVRLKNKIAKISSPKKAMKCGIAYLPSERKLDGLIIEHSVKENISLASLDNKLGTFKMNLKKENKLAQKWVDKLDIKTPNLKALVQRLSGGNQQKVIVAKWLETNPEILILNEPTRGIDVGAKVEIYKLMEQLCAEGHAIIMISSELPEIIGVADRIIVVHEGKITGELSRDEFTQEKLMNYAIGGV